MRHQGIPRVVGKWLIAPIMLFALYVQFHGDFSPGGGFQAGVIFAAAVVLYTLIFGLQATKQIVKPASLKFSSPLASCSMRARDWSPYFSVTTSWIIMLWIPRTQHTDNIWASFWSNSAWVLQWLR